ncbi:hypothetical protein RRG08_019298 [Elysia crispata]|uniref:Uncharacterized protein n=1 Tax=Elysia crispata TaxID=231223 RepID=A0AAE1D1B6_9GAST|nr:hypothetical protein RRG08_019298 [Elysia crispata]
MASSLPSSMNGHSMGRGEKEEHAMVPKAGWGEKSGGWDDGDGSGDEEGCGVGSCRPGFLKRFSHIALFSILMGAASMYVDVMMSYLGTQFIWLERLYGLTPGQTKMLLVWGKIGFLVLVPFLSVMARRWHMPRTLAITAVIVALAAIICVMPYPVHKSDLYAPPNVTKETQFTASVSITVLPNVMSPVVYLDSASVSITVLPNVMSPVVYLDSASVSITVLPNVMSPVVYLDSASVSITVLPDIMSPVVYLDSASVSITVLPNVMSPVVYLDSASVSITVLPNVMSPVVYLDSASVSSLCYLTSCPL